MKRKYRTLKHKKLTEKISVSFLNGNFLNASYYKKLSLRDRIQR